MRLVCLADTHNQHSDIEIPEGDVLIHAGDFTDGGSERETQDFLNWIISQPHTHKILVPGNHDFFFEKEELQELPENIHVLIDKGIEIEDHLFWGSPYIPGMGNWSFSRERGADIREHWQLIPENTDILITHSPPYGILDQIGTGVKLGCEELQKRVEQIKPDYHLFGHIHHSAGKMKMNGVQYYNLSVLDERFRIMNTPHIIDL